MPSSSSFSRTIYYNNKPLVLTNDAVLLRQSDVRARGYQHHVGAFPRNYRLALEYLDQRRTLGAVIEDISPQALLRGIEDQFIPVDAAGGVVQNELGGVLMIYRRGRWDLPKGKRDEGESMEACAVREVREETGLAEITLGDLIAGTYHIYAQRGEKLLKHTAWYHMKAASTAALQPQHEESIEEARWVQPEDLQPILFKSYEAIKQVMRTAGLCC